MDVGLLTLKSLAEPLDDRMLSFCSSCTMRPQKRLNVRGSRTAGLTSISTFFAVCTYTACATAGLRHIGIASVVAA